MGPAADSRIKTADAGIPPLHTESEVRAAEHRYQLSKVMALKVLQL